MAAAPQHSSTPAQDPLKGAKVIIIAAVILLVGSGVFLLNRPSTTPQPSAPSMQYPTTVPAATSDSAIIYGVWERNNTVVHAVTGDGRGDAVIARLPLDIKNIRPVSDTSFVYIGGVQNATGGTPGTGVDHGTSVVFYDSLTSQEQIVATADPGWGIDSLIISPDKRTIAYWQVQFAANKNILEGGKSRVYTASLASFPATPVLIYDEQATANSIVHYPLFFDHAGRLYADGFSPNVDGWNRGLMRSDALGANKEEILAVNAYNSDPILSPVANTIAYTAYDPAVGVLLQGRGTSGVSGTEYMNPNTVRVIDLDTRVERVLAAQGDRLYYDPVWKSDGAALFARSYGADGTQLTQPALPLAIHLPTGTIETMDGGSIVDGLILSFGNDGVVSGVPAASGATGNLGATNNGNAYAPVLAGFAINHPDSTITTMSAANAQYITTTTRRLPDTIVFEPKTAGNRSLQLQTFVLKPQIETRPAQQNDIPPNVPVRDGRPQCKPLYKALTAQGGVTSSETILTAPTIDAGLVNITVTAGEDPTLQLGQFGPKTAARQVISGPIPSYKEMKPLLQKQYKCFDSPLYLYHARPMPVNVTVANAEILESNPLYDETTGWNVYATPQGTKIDYAYASRFTNPGTGYVVSREDLVPFLSLYARKAGLNERETEDYTAFWQEQLPVSDYYVVSHYRNPRDVMNMAITPTPDTLIQVVMYFKPIGAEEVSSYDTLPVPSFSPVPSRTGFTAVDWSGIVDGE